jgi:DNA-binding transcriptional LysR family regulator
MRQLRYFVAVAEHLHYGNAARVAFVSQPALSQQINLLEDEIGVELFARNKRQKHHRVELTEAGKVFLVEARRILQLAENAVENARRVGHQRKTLRLGIYKMMLRERIVEIVQIISSRFPDLEIKLVEYQSFLQVQDAIRDEIIDLGITLLPLQHKELSFNEMISSHLSVLLPINHRLAARQFLYLDDLKNEKWVEIEKPLRPFLRELEALLQKMGFDRESGIVLEVNSFDMLRSMVELGIGISFIPSISRISDTPGVVAKPLMDDPETPFSSFVLQQGVAWKTDKTSPTTVAVSESLCAFYADYDKAP